MSLNRGLSRCRRCSAFTESSARPSTTCAVCAADGGTTHGYRYPVAVALKLSPRRPGDAELARQYAGLIRQRKPQGPYSPMGWSLGAVISLFVARELEKQGEEVVFLGLADAPLVDGRGRSDQELGQVLGEFLEIFLGTRSRLPAEASVDASVVASHIRAQGGGETCSPVLPMADELIGVFETVATLRKLCWDGAAAGRSLPGFIAGGSEGREAEARQFQAQMSFTLAQKPSARPSTTRSCRTSACCRSLTRLASGL
ncbi:thioesterase domain-containing protein [Pseudomonas aeruginosa]